MIGSAEISGPNDEYRTMLKRVWDEARALLVVGMLNPSDADAQRNDPTILTLVHFGTFWGFGGLWVVNEYSFRSSTPTALATVADPVGPGNAAAVTDAMIYALTTSGWFLGAWGNGGRNNGLLVSTARELSLPIGCLGFTLNGSPKHPLARGLHRIPRDQKPLPWSPPA